MYIVAARTLLLYALVLLAVRMMGKSELSKMSPFQLVIVFMIAELATIPIDDPDVSLINGIAAIFTLMFLQILCSWLSIKSEHFKNFLSGKPTVLIDKGKLNIRELRRLRITTFDLAEQLRLMNYASISDIQFAVMESNGQLSVIPKADIRPVTPRDLHLAVNNEVMPVILVTDGTIYRNNLVISGINESDFQHRLSEKGIDGYEQIFLAICDGSGQIHIYLKNGQGQPYAREVKL